MDVEVPTHYAGIMEFSCGVIGNINMSFDVWDSQLPGIEIYGTKGMITVPDPNLFGGSVKVFDGMKLAELVKENPRSFFCQAGKDDNKYPQCREEIPLAFPADEDPKVQYARAWRVGHGPVFAYRT